MDVTVRLLASYRRYLPGEQADQAGYVQDVATGTRLSDILASLPIPAGEPYTFFVNGRHAEPDQVLEEGDIISVFPAAGGG